MLSLLTAFKLVTVLDYLSNNNAVHSFLTVSPSSFKQQRLHTETTKLHSTIDGPPLETKPDYKNIHGPMGKDIDTIFLTLFRSKMAEKIGVDSSLPLDDYSGILELVKALNARFSNREEIQIIAQDVLSKCVFGA